MEKDWKRHRSYKCNLETSKKIYESLKKGKKNYDYSIYWNDWNILWMDDTNMKSKIL